MQSTDHDSFAKWHPIRRIMTLSFLNAGKRIVDAQVVGLRTSERSLVGSTAGPVHWADGPDRLLIAE